VDTDHVAAEGHSMGGRDAALSAHDNTVDAWIGVAPVVPVPDAATGGHDLIAEGEDGFDPAAGDFDLAGYLRSATPPDKPSMLIVADKDVAFPASDRRAVFDWLPAPKRYVLLANTGHSAFENESRGTQEHGGSKVADALGFAADSVERRLLENGCLPGYTPVEKVWAVWDHLVVAQLRWVFDIDRATAAASLLKSYLDATFPGLIAEYVTEP
jgi:dienelactone hydrolase